MSHQARPFAFQDIFYKKAARQKHIHNIISSLDCKANSGSARKYLWLCKVKAKTIIAVPKNVWFSNEGLSQDKYCPKSEENTNFYSFSVAISWQLYAVMHTHALYKSTCVSMRILWRTEWMRESGSQETRAHNAGPSKYMYICTSRRPGMLTLTRKRQNQL
jgi:hypothetical protein